MNELWGQIGNFWFPIVVSLYLLVRIESKLDALTAAITKLGEKLEWVEGTPHEVPAPVVTGRAVCPHPATPMLSPSGETQRA